MFESNMEQPIEDNAYILWSYPQYYVKRDGQWLVRQWFDGSKQAAPLPRALAKTYSSYVEHSIQIQQQFFTLVAEQNLYLFGGDTKDAFAYSLSPGTPTFIKMDNQYYELYLDKFKVKLDKSKILPVLQTLKGHPESWKLY